MKLIVAGSRHFNFGTMIMDAAIVGIPGLRRMIPGYIDYDQNFKLTEVVSGGATGIDRMGEIWSEASFWGLPGRPQPELTIFKADWDKYGSRAGPIRNSKMAVYADALLLIWDGKSAGSAHMRSEMIRLKKPVYELILRSTNED